MRTLKCGCKVSTSSDSWVKKGFEMSGAVQKKCEQHKGNGADNAKRPYATNTKRRTYTVTDETHEQLRKLGQGNASAGIREAVKRATN